jgi:hypothetical protein
MVGNDTTQREYSFVVRQAGYSQANRTKNLAITASMRRRAIPPGMNWLVGRARHEEPHSFPGQIMTRCGRRMRAFHPLGRIHH